MNTLLKKYHQLFFSTIILLTFIATSHSYSQNGWFSQYSGVSNNLSSIEFVNPLTGWVVGTDGRIIKTTNGGESWVAQNSNDTINLSRVSFANENTGWAIGSHYYYNPFGQYYELLLRTTDSGLNWQTIIRSSFGGFEVSIKALDENRILKGSLGSDFTGFSTSGSLMISTNGGTNWSDAIPQGFFEVGFGYTNIDFINENTGWVLAQYSTCTYSVTHLLRTTDGAQNWNIIRTDSNNSPIYSIGGYQFLNESIGYAVGNYLYKTIDSGVSWTELNSIDNIRKFTFINQDTGWVIRYNNQIYKTTDGCLSWEQQSLPASSTISKIYFINPEVGWVIGMNGTILKTITGGLTDLQTESTETPQTFYISQNFPNPFNPVTKIKFDVPLNEHLSLTVYNSLGQQVAVLVNQTLQPGSYEYTFDASGLTSGVYFYKLNSESFAETKRMLLLK